MPGRFPGSGFRRCADRLRDPLVDSGPVVVDFRVHRDAMVWPMVAAGTSNDEIKYARDLAPEFDEDDL